MYTRVQIRFFCPKKNGWLFSFVTPRGVDLSKNYHENPLRDLLFDELSIQFLFWGHPTSPKKVLHHFTRVTDFGTDQMGSGWEVFLSFGQYNSAGSAPMQILSRKSPGNPTFRFTFDPNFILG